MRSILKYLILAFIGLQLVACANFKREQVAQTIGDLETSEEQSSTYAPDEFYGEIPSVHNAQVQKWMNYFTGRGRKYMKVYLERSTRYLPLMKAVFRERGMPEDLVYIAMIESGFNFKAYSHASAVGYWQFIRGTGKRYNLKIDAFVDERRDPILSTYAAANYFHSLYSIFGDWFLAMASYNAGENRISRAVVRYKTRNFWDLTKRRRLPRETQNYIPKYLAAREIGKNPEKYGFTNLNYQEAFQYDTIEVDKTISLDKLGKTIGVAYNEMKRLNPRYRTDYVPLYKDRKHIIRVPKGQKAEGQVAITSSYSDKPLKYAANTFSYRIKRGDTLSGIAKRHGTSVRKLKALNNLSSRTLLRIGRRLRVPEYGSKKLLRATRAIKVSKGTYHTVRRGENLSTIARAYGLSVSKLRRLNGLKRRSIIRIGQRLKVNNKSTPGSSQVAKSTSVASYYVVKRGDNLSSISSKTGASLRDLRNLNGLGRRSLIKTGQRLRLPSSDLDRVHVVRRGENLSLIAKKYNVTVNNLARQNGLKNLSSIQVGKRLSIPD